MTLIITNGDSAAGNLRAAADIEAGTILPWRDVLHIGPLTHAETPADFWRPRVETLCATGAEEAVEGHFAERYSLLAGLSATETVDIWMEHDLYDQLQLVQILDDLSRHFGRTEGIRLIQADDYLGHYSPETIGQFAGAARPVDSGMIKTAQALWKALCAPTPEPVAERAAAPVAGFPFMQAALLRFLQELPGRDGLSRTQRTMLEVIDAEPTTAGRLFGAVIAKEEAQFMGDATFFADLDALAFCAVPALAGLPCPSTGLMDPEAGDDGRSAYMQSKPALTPLGTAILAGEADFLGENSIDRWWGGTHLRDGNVWRIDRDTGDLVHP